MDTWSALPEGTAVHVVGDLRDPPSGVVLGFPDARAAEDAFEGAREDADDYIILLFQRRFVALLDGGTHALPVHISCAEGRLLLLGYSDRNESVKMMRVQAPLMLRRGIDYARAVVRLLLRADIGVVVADALPLPKRLTGRL